jgi:hypothetical protein
MCKRIPFGLAIAIVVSSVCQSGQIVHGQDRWTEADRVITRLSPNAFSELPRQVMRKLLSLGCTIPQARGISDQHNVIKGKFQRRKQTDWAVLCSRKRISSILIFWKGSADFSEIARAPDRVFLQTIDGAGTIGFSRAISSADKSYIMEHYREYHGPRPPPISHQGIDDGFLEKGSTIHYYYGRKWRELQGAD